MTATAEFATGPVIGAVLLGSAETNLQVPTQASAAILAGATKGTQVYEIAVEATNTTLVATTVAGLVYLFLHDGTTYHLFDTVTVRAITVSASVAPFRSISSDFAAGTGGRYANLTLKTGWSIRAAQSIAGNANLLKVSAFGADIL